LLAHTSPVYVRVDGRDPPADAAAVGFLIGHLARGRAWVGQPHRFTTAEKARRHMLAIFDAAGQALLARLRPSGTIDTPAPPA
jgi:hypothetical protein